MALERWLVACALSALGGCGTFEDQSYNGGRIYGGVRHDIEMLVRPRYHGTVPPLCAVDIPLSLVADTVFLPLTAFQTLARSQMRALRPEEQSAALKVADPQERTR